VRGQNQIALVFFRVRPVTVGALEHHKQALAISREIGDRRGEGNRLGNLSAAYRNLGQCEEAIAHFTRALAISREIGNRQRSVLSDSASQPARL
jgi:tetratricopeptide (TPR) repeat protein